MDEKIVNARGKACPEPLIMTKKAIRELGPGQKMRVIVDNETSKTNVERFLADNNMPALCTCENGVFSLSVNTNSRDLVQPDTANYCSPAMAGGASPGNHVIVIASDQMGNGPEELGAILIKAFINTLKEVSPLPSKIIFYNRGILLASEGSPVLEALNDLEHAGVTILSCGACVNYFSKHGLIRAGTVTNMYTIIETLTNAGKVIRP